MQESSWLRCQQKKQLPFVVIKYHIRNLYGVTSLAMTPYLMQIEISKENTYTHKAI